MIFGWRQVQLKDLRVPGLGNQGHLFSASEPLFGRHRDCNDHT